MNSRRDNPVGQAMERLAGNRPSFQARMAAHEIRMTNLSYTPSLTDILKNAGPGGIYSSTYKQYHGGQEALGLASKLESQGYLGMGGGGLSTVLSRLSASKVGHYLTYDPNESSLFLGIGEQQLALPLQKGGGFRSGIVNLGRSTRATRGAVFGTKGGITRGSFAEAFYNKLASKVQATQKTILGTSLSSLVPQDYNLGYEGGAKIGSLLLSGSQQASVMGYSSTSLTEVYSAGSAFHNIRDMIAGGRSQILTGIMSGKVGEVGAGIINYNQGISQFVSTLQARGMVGLLPYINPEVMTGNRVMSLPTLDTLRFMGPFVSPEGAGKGLRYMHRAAVLSAGDISHIQRVGKNPFPAFFTSAERETALSEGAHVLTRKQVARIAVIDFDSNLSMLRLAGDSGSLLLDTSRFHTYQPLGRISLRGAAQDPHTIAALENLFGIRLGEARSKEYLALNVAIPKGLFYRDRIPDPRNIGQGSALQHLISSSGDSGWTRWNSILGGNKRARLSGLYFEAGDIHLDFQTATRRATGNVALIAHGRRTVGAPLGPGHPLYSKLKGLRRQGVELGVSASEYLKNIPPEELLVHSIEVLRRASKVRSKFGMLSGMETLSRLQGIKVNPLNADLHGKTFRVGNIEVDPIVAAESIQQFVRTLEDPIRDEILHGTKTGITAPGVRDVRLFYTHISNREDQISDQSIRRGRLTAGKIRTLAQSSGLLGYSDPGQDPVFRSIRRTWAESTGFHYHGKTNEILYPRPIKQFINALAGRVDERALENYLIRPGSFAPLPVGLSPTALGEGLTKLQLKGTIFDVDLMRQKGLYNKTVYLDLGRLAGKYNIWSKNIEDNIVYEASHIRYLPINLKLLGVKYTSTGKLRLSGKYAAKGLYNIVAALQGGGYVSEKVEKAQVEEWFRHIVGRLPGKKTGLLEKAASVFLPSSRTRLIPDTVGVFSRDDMFNPSRVFDIYSTEESIRSEYLPKIGRKKVEEFISGIKKHGWMPVLTNPDPAQRPEHFQLMRYRINKGAVDPRRGVGAQIVHPFRLMQAERDLDKDVKATILLNPSLTRAEAEARILRQEKMIESELAIWSRVMSKSPGEATLAQKAEARMMSDIKASVITSWDKPALEHVAKQILGQKSFAPGGYTILRTGRGLGALSQTQTDSEFLRVLKGKSGGSLSHVTPAFISKIRSLMGSDFRNASIEAAALTQSVMQAGVGKAKASSPLLTLAQDIGELRGYTKSERGQFGMAEDIETRFTEAFRKFYGSIGKDWDDWKEYRFGGVLNRLMESKGISTEMMIRDLERGSTETLERLKDSAAETLGNYFGIASRVYAASGSSMVDSLTPMESGKILPTQWAKKIFRGVMGTSPEGEIPIQKGATNLAERALSAIKNTNLASHIKPGMGKIAAIAGIAGLAGSWVGGQIFTPKAPLPPDINVEGPSDSFPSRDRVGARISAEYAPPAARMYPVRSFSTPPMMASRSANQGEISFRDSQNSTSQHAINRHMKSIARSDFVY